MTITTTETSSVNDAIRDWLELVGAQYHVREAHHVLRPDDGLKPVRDFFTFSFERSSGGDAVMDASTVGTGNAANLKWTAPFERALKITCHSEDGMEILEAVLLSTRHPEIEEILHAARVVIVDMGEIENETTFDETKTDWAYSVSMRLRKHTSFALARTDHLVTDVEAAGVLIQADDVGELPVNIEG